MLSFSDPAPVTVTCHKGLAPWVAQEVAALGFRVEDQFVTGVRLHATLHDCMRLNLNLRCGSQVLYRLKAFTAANADALYGVLSAMRWESILPADGYFSVTGTVSNDTISNNLFANLRVKDAIVDRMRQATGRRPDSGAEARGAVVHLYWKGDRAEIFLDTSGQSLALHGYRRLPGRAPMLEGLAAATILATRWDGCAPFVNPMCGSGTLAIEAAMMAANMRPGLNRTNYAFMHLHGYDEAAYLSLRGQAEATITDPPPGLRILATDISALALEQAEKNARLAGVADLIEFAVCDFADTPVPERAGGVVFMNPEYGERLGEPEALEATYARIGDFLKQQCGGYRGYVFTGSPSLAGKIGLKPARRTEFYNGPIECRLLEYELYAGSRRVG